MTFSRYQIKLKTRRKSKLAAQKIYSLRTNKTFRTGPSSHKQWKNWRRNNKNYWGWGQLKKVKRSIWTVTESGCSWIKNGALSKKRSQKCWKSSL